MRKKFTVLDASGRVLMTGSGHDPENMILEAGQTLLLAEAPPGADWWDGTWQYKPAQPTVEHTWNWSTKTWEDARTLDEVKAAKRKEMKAARDATQLAGFNSGGYTYGSSLEDQAEIQRLTLQAALAKIDGAAFDATLTTVDGVNVTLGRNNLINLYGNLQQALSAAQAQFRAKRQEIVAATTVAQVKAITWAG